MIISFYSNYLTHHQIPFCNAMVNQKGVEFHFVSTMPMESDRKTGGWNLDKEYDYELKAYVSKENESEAMRLAKISDVIIIGSAPEKYVDYRMKNGDSKLTFRYSERIYKGGYWRALSPRGVFIRLKTFFRYINKPLYMLCASAYTAGDLAILGSYLGRCYKWGYFPEVKKYESIDELIKEKEPKSIAWVARFIDWKHPETAINVAKRLKDEGYSFKLNMIGTGAMEEQIKNAIVQNGLQSYVSLLGSMKPEEVREYMEKSQIFLFTSDRNEGWGAVLNESMNSGCAVVASNAIGSVPFLIENGQNGYAYQSEEELFIKVKQLLDAPEECDRLGKNAYKTLTSCWNAELAAERFLKVCNSLKKGNKVFYPEGVCSKSKIIIGRSK